MNKNKQELWGCIPQEKDQDYIDNALLNDIISGSFTYVPSRNVFYSTKSVKPIKVELCSSKVKCDEKILQTLYLAKYCDQINSASMSSQDDQNENIEEINSLRHENIHRFIEKVNQRRCQQLVPYNRGALNDTDLENIPEISSDTSYELLRVAVATLLAFNGFSKATDQCLYILTEVAKDYMKKVFRLLSVNMDKFSLNNENYGFHDAIDRTCHEIGIGGVKNVLQFYQESVIERMKTTCQRYHRLKDSQPRESQASTIPEEIDNSGESAMEIPELHVPNDMILTDTFKAGYQMLNRLENIQQIQNDTE